MQYNTIQHNTITMQYNTTQHKLVYTKIQYLRLETDGSALFENRCTRCTCHNKLNRFQKLQIRYSVYQQTKKTYKKAAVEHKNHWSKSSKV